MKIDVSTSEISPHPGEVTHCLSQALSMLKRLEDAAVARGDEHGAESWRAASALVAQSVEEVGAAKSRQTWGAKRAEACPTCRRLP